MRDRFEHNSGAHRGCPLHHRHIGPPSKSPTPVVVPPSLIGPDARDAIDDEEADLIVGDAANTDKKTVLKARIGQGKYRNSLINYWKTCSVTGCGPTTILVASHIIPWSKCNSNSERIDRFNGLLLTPNLDKLFDRGLITFDANGMIRLSTRLSSADASTLGVHSNLKLRKLPNSVKKYLARHVSEQHFKP